MEVGGLGGMEVAVVWSVDYGVTVPSFAFSLDFCCGGAASVDIWKGGGG